MNKRQTTCLGIGITVITLMWLYPPWEYTVVMLGSNTAYNIPTGYYSIFDIPSIRILRSLRANELQSAVVGIDFSLLGSQCVIAILATGGLIYTFKDKKEGQPLNKTKVIRLILLAFVLTIVLALVLTIVLALVYLFPPAG